MTRVLAYFLLGFGFILLQTSLLPILFPAHLKPDLLLILVIYLGLTEDYLRGGILAYAFGSLLDVFAGNSPGIYGLTLLAVFLAVRGAAGRLNTESSLLLLVMAFLGTLFQGGLVAFPLGFLADAGALWRIVLHALLPQALVNLAATLVLLRGATALQKRFAPKSDIPGLKRLDSRYES